MTYYSDNHITIYNKDCRSMGELGDESVQCVVTSPPYWGLRKYSGEQELIWGDNHCEHQWVDHAQFHGAPVYKGKTRWQHAEGDSPAKTPGIYETGAAGQERATHTNFCSLCGAWKGSYGLEPQPEMYIAHTIEILREIRRVLRKDGVVFWNIGDSYFGGGHGYGNEITGKQATNKGTTDDEFREYHYKVMNQNKGILKPKDLCLIPFRVAIAAQEDGWWVRSVIIWSKPNPMPESVTDRPTESHEYILMLTKSSRYYWDADAVREPISDSYADDKRPHGVLRQRFYPNSKYVKAGMMEHDSSPFPTGERATGRNIRSVWEFPTQPYPEAHFAVFPEKLPEICIKAATPEVGCCSKCGGPWERMTQETKDYQAKNVGGKSQLGGLEQGKRFKDRYNVIPKTLGWQPTCKCNADKVPSVVLDPFAGAGTTLWVAKKLNRNAVGYEISEEYCKLNVERNRQQVMI